MAVNQDYYRDPIHSFLFGFAIWFHQAFAERAYQWLSKGLSGSSPSPGRKLTVVICSTAESARRNNASFDLPEYPGP
jgi:hypothetical protein